MSARTHNDTMYRLLVQSVTDYAICLLDPAGRVSNWNAGAEKAKGYTAEQIVGQHFSCFYTEEDRAKGLPQESLRIAAKEGRHEGEGWRVCRDGTRFWAHVTMQSVMDEDGQLVGFAKITRDLTTVKRQGDEVSRTRTNLDRALSNMSHGLCLFDAEEKLVLCNGRFYECLGTSPEGIYPGMSFLGMLELLHLEEGLPEPRAKDQACRIREKHFAELQKGDGEWGLESTRKGRLLSFQHRLLPDGGWVTTLNDITERRAIEQKIVHLAQFDPLTELANRSAFHASLSTTLEEDVACTLLYLDLDRFKPINDSLGHAAGDQALQIVAERIKGQIRTGDVSARLGGDEFAVLLRNCGSRNEASVIAERLIREVGRPLQLRGFEATVGASVGIALSPVHGRDADLLLRNADLALYAAKGNGRGRLCFYENGMEKALLQRRELENDLRKALAAGEFALHYQPVTNRHRHHITSVEALLRWTHPKRGQVSPADFIPVAEELGLMPEIGGWVLRTACEEAMNWPSDIAVAVNLSTTQFCLPDLVKRVREVLRATGLPPKRLELEITETAMITDLPSATQVLHELRQCGVQVALDDFGTGYSSLSFLRTLPFTRIKIDRSFTQDLGSKPAAKAIIRAVTGLCQSLGVSTTAEGVETEAQLAMLQGEGCEEIQGYLVSRPLPPLKLKRWMQEYVASEEQPGVAGEAPGFRHAGQERKAVRDDDLLPGLLAHAEADLAPLNLGPVEA